MSVLLLLIMLPGSPQTRASTISLVNFYPNKPAFLPLFLVIDTLCPLDSRAVILYHGSDYNVTLLKCPQWNPMRLHSKWKCLPFFCSVEYDLPPTCSFSLLTCLFSMLVFSSHDPSSYSSLLHCQFSAQMPVHRGLFSPFALVNSNYSGKFFFLWFISLASCGRVYSWINT